jgi:hypothetical protein
MCYQARNVPIRTFLEDDHSFGPEDIAKLSAAFEAARSKLGRSIAPIRQQWRSPS